MKSILQDWVMECGLRHQGVLLAGIRGCDTVPSPSMPAFFGCQIPDKLKVVDPELMVKCADWIFVNAPEMEEFFRQIKSGERRY